jgi:hypothetical protein
MSEKKNAVRQFEEVPMMNRQKFGNRRGDCSMRYLLLIAAGIVIMGCSPDMAVNTISLDQTPSTGVEVGGSVSGKGAASVVEPGSSTGTADWDIKDAYDVDADLALTSSPDEAGGFVTVKQGTAVTVSATVCDTYSWFLNGDALTGSGNGVAVDTGALEKGVHELDFIGEIKGSPYSKGLKIKVE